MDIRVKVLRASFFLCCSFFWASNAVALDVVKIAQKESAKDHRTEYAHLALELALEATVDKYGPYEIRVVEGNPNDSRMLKLLQSGDFINVAMAITRPTWEREVTPVRIPVRMGLLNYRLLMVHRENLDKFAQIKTVDDLRKLKAGLQTGWSSIETMRRQNFPVVQAYDYESTFAMLNQKRFDYIPRGAHEIYKELELRKDEYENLVVEPTLALYIPAPCYIFVSPKLPRLAERIEAGLQGLIESGELKKLIMAHFGDDIAAANFAQRRILDIGNDLLSPETPFNVPEYWIDLVNDETLSKSELK